MTKQRAPLKFSVGENSKPPVVQQVAEGDLPAKKSTKDAKSRAGRQFIAAHVLPEAAKQFKLLVVEQGHTTQSLLIEAINDLFTKYGKSRIADE